MKTLHTIYLKKLDKPDEYYQMEHHVYGSIYEKRYFGSPAEAHSYARDLWMGVDHYKVVEVDAMTGEPI